MRRINFRAKMEAIGMKIVKAILTSDNHVVYALCIQDKVYYIYDALGRAYFADNLYAESKDMKDMLDIHPAITKHPTKRCASMDVKPSKDMKVTNFRKNMEVIGMEIVNIAQSFNGYVVFAVCKKDGARYIYDGLWHAYEVNNQHNNDKHVINLHVIQLAVNDIKATRCPYKDVRLDK